MVCGVAGSKAYNPQIRAPEIKIAATAARPMSSLRESRVTGGRSGRRRRFRLPDFDAPRSRSPEESPFGAHNANAAFGTAVAETELSRNEKAIDDYVAAADAIVHELRGLALAADDEEGRHLALGDPARERDVDLPAVIEGAQRPSGRTVAVDRYLRPVQPSKSEPNARNRASARRVAQHHKRATVLSATKEGCPQN